METEKEISELNVALLSAGRDRPYAFGMTTALLDRGITLDVIGGNDLDCPSWQHIPHMKFLNLRGDMSEGARLEKKILRVLLYYVRLVLYAATAKPRIFHILWNNKCETLDRIGLMLYYKLLGKKTLLTVHNVNARERDSGDTWYNRQTLKIQYRLVDHLFVHTERMKREIVTQFDVPGAKISVIPFGINNAVPHTDMSSGEARKRLGIPSKDHTMLFYGNIAPYKGLEYLIEAFRLVMARAGAYRLIIAGNPKNYANYWASIQDALLRHPNLDRILRKIEFIPDAETEVYFKATDVVVLPYRHIFQSGVLSLAYSFGLPVIATDVGALREDIIEGKTGFVCSPEDPNHLAKVIENYFASDLYHSLESRRQEIQEYARQRYSWEIVSKLTTKVYEGY